MSLDPKSAVPLLKMIRIASEEGRYFDELFKILEGRLTRVEIWRIECCQGRLTRVEILIDLR